jgi:tRNA pseudouridine55 synthase
MQSMFFDDGAIILFNKPLGWTSFQAVSAVRRITGIKKVGHAGTLDPLATGLLIICVGKYTKRINEFMGQQKEYTGTITLGYTTPTYDLESEPVNAIEVNHLTAETLHVATKPFIGSIQQIPPAHSAIKKNGVRLYEMARKGIEVKPEPRNVLINAFDIETATIPVVPFKVICGTGTYIRSLANDYGAALGVGGYLSSLCRTRIGESLIENADTEASLIEKMKWHSFKKGS